MGTSMKEMFKGLKYTLSHMFVKEPEIEIEIGLPTDVKHVSHIGWDGPSGTAPSWMSEFKTGPEFAKSSISKNRSTLSPLISQDSAEPPSDLPPAKRRQRRKKNKATSSSKSNAGSTSGSSRAAGAKRKSVEDSNKKISRRGTD